jgi:hypothetical protein
MPRGFEEKNATCGTHRFGGLGDRRQPDIGPAAIVRSQSPHHVGSHVRLLPPSLIAPCRSIRSRHGQHFNHALSVSHQPEIPRWRYLRLLMTWSSCGSRDLNNLLASRRSAPISKLPSDVKCVYLRASPCQTLQIDWVRQPSNNSGNMNACPSTLALRRWFTTQSALLGLLVTASPPHTWCRIWLACLHSNTADFQRCINRARS